MTIEECFSKKLRKFRKENGLTQSGLAEVSGISFKYVYKLEKGEANPTIKIVDILAKTLGVPTISFFLDEEGNKIDFD